MENPYQTPQSELAQGVNFAKQKFSWSWFLFSFKGRINRLQYWLYNFVLIAVSIFVFVAAGANQTGEEMAGLVILITIWPTLAVQVKRWHDRDKSGWWVLINFIPIIAIWAIIENGFLAGSERPNFYGNAPP